MGAVADFLTILMFIYRSPLASIYSTSTMENHHFNMAINILQQVCNQHTKNVF